MSAREQAGFRGPVKSCIVEEVASADNTRPATDGAAQRKQRTVQNFDRAGRLISYQGSDGSGEWASENSYDADGRFLKNSSSSASRVYHEVEYAYDDNGRLASYTTKTRDGQIKSICSYDAARNKTVTTSFDQKVLAATRRLATAGSRVSSLQAGFGVPDGGCVRTRYDSEDRPLEAQVLALDEQVVSRVMLTYNDAGKLLEEKQIVDSPEFMIPIKERAQMLLQGGTLEELRTQLSKFTGGEDGQHVMSYTYDAQGRMLERRTRTAPFMEQTVTMTYNSQGDIAEEHWVIRGQRGATSDTEGNVIPDSAAAEPSTHSILHGYVYDDQGNWTEQTITKSERKDGPVLSSTTKKRTLTYY